jgi:hypothetical protein
MKGSESGQLTNQEKLLKKLQAMSNDTEQGEGKLNF